MAFLNNSFVVLDCLYYHMDIGEKCKSCLVIGFIWSQCGSSPTRHSISNPSLVGDKCDERSL